MAFTSVRDLSVVRSNNYGNNCVPCGLHLGSYLVNFGRFLFALVKLSLRTAATETAHESA